MLNLKRNETPKRQPSDFVIPWGKLIEELRAAGNLEVLGYLNIREKERGISLDRLQEILTLVYEQIVGVPQSSRKFSERVSEYYDDSVWLLNGLVHESNEQAIEDRLHLAHLLVNENPGKGLEFGGGIGTVSRLVSELNSNLKIDLLDVSTKTTAFTKIHLKDYPNIQVVNKPRTPYNFILSSEVLEHLIDPIAEIVRFNKQLAPRGALVLTWSFTPVCRSHIEANFHLEHRFHRLVPLLGFEIEAESGRAFRFRKTKEVNSFDVLRARFLERIFKFRHHLSVK